MAKFAANLTMMFNEVEFLDRFEAAANAGFKAVEYLFPYDYDKDQVAERLNEHGLTQVLHNLPAGDWDAGDRGNACQPGRVGEFQEGVGSAIGIGIRKCLQKNVADLQLLDTFDQCIEIGLLLYRVLVIEVVEIDLRSPDDRVILRQQKLGRELINTRIFADQDAPNPGKIRQCIDPGIESQRDRHAVAGGQVQAR